jgi:hypothetical protein
MPEFDALDDQVLAHAAGPVGRVLRAAGAGLDEAVELDPRLLAELRAAVTSGIGGVVDLTKPRRHRVVRTLVIAGLVGAGATSAAAANGSLPSGVQGVAHDMADAVGLDIPEGNGPPQSSGAQDGEGHGRSDEAPGRPDEPGQPADPGSRAEEAPGPPADVPTGVGPEGTTPPEGGTIPGTGETVPTTSLPEQVPDPPEDPGPPDDRGPPADAGRPDDPGPAAGAVQRATAAETDGDG